MGITSRRSCEVLGCPFLGIYICIYCPKKSKKKTEFRLSAMPGPFEDVEHPDRRANQALATEQEIQRTYFGPTNGRLYIVPSLAVA
jgi:hypothetical protein